MSDMDKGVHAHVHTCPCLTFVPPLHISGPTFFKCFPEQIL